VRILIIEDEKKLANALREGLTAEHYDVTIAATGEDGFFLASQRSFWQNGYAERLIGSVRRECLDHLVVLSGRHLRHLLLSYMKYSNGARTHLSLEKDAPVSRAVDCAGTFFVAQPWADCITNMPGFDLRQAQAASDKTQQRSGDPWH
jgi:CheY-like chemotaxis protein